MGKININKLNTCDKLHVSEYFSLVSKIKRLEEKLNEYSEVDRREVKKEIIKLNQELNFPTEREIYLRSKLSRIFVA